MRALRVRIAQMLELAMYRALPADARAVALEVVQRGQRAYTDTHPWEAGQ